MTHSTAALSEPLIVRLARGRAPVTLELGCGASKKDPSSIGIDIAFAPGVDVVGDALEALRALPEASVDRIFSSHFLEHVSDLDALLAQCERVLKPDGVLDSVVPHHTNPYFYSDPTHRNFFGLYTMSYYAEDGVFHRRVPGYARRPQLRLVRVDLVFKSERPFYGRHAIKKVWQVVFGTTRYMKELYEEMFSGFLGCYEVRYILVKKEAPATP